MTEQLLKYLRLLLLSLVCSCPAQASDEDENRGSPVEVVRAQEQAIHRVLQLTGTVTSARVARLSTATSGLVSIIHVDAGSRVATGQVLLELDPELSQLQLRSATAAVEQARNALADARRRLEEAQALAPQRSIAATVVRDFAAEVAEDQAALHQAEADAAYRQGILARHQLKAPFEGVVAAKLTELGEWVDPGQPVMELVALDDVRLDFPVAEDYLADIHADTPLTFSLNADTGLVYEGRVATVVPVTDPGDRTFLLRVLAENIDRTLMPGMSVRASLRLATGRRGVVVPRDATVRSPDGRVVVWSVEDGADGPLARENLVHIGVAFDELVEIRDGLPAGARVVVHGNEALRNGQRIQIR